MALITDATLTWSDPVLLDANELWQARSGSVYLSTGSDPTSDDGLLLVEKQAVLLSSGQLVRYRKNGAIEVLIVREAV